MDAKEKAALAWAEEYLTQNGYNIQGQPEIVRDMQWSRVVRFSTSKGFIYFKHMAPAFSIEPLVLEFLSKHELQSIITIITSNKTLSCFLMKDAGRPFREHLKNNYQIDCVCDALQTYAQIQILSIPHVDALLAMGLPDWRLSKIPNLYLEFVSREDLLKADGLTATEIEALQNIYSKVSVLCEKLSEYGIPDTLEHGDFHDNNILIQNDRLVFNDWGDTSIANNL